MITNSRKHLVALTRSLILLVIIIFTAVPQPARSMPAEAPEAASAPAEVFGVSVGAHLRPAIGYGNLLNTYNQQVGKNSATLMWFSDWRGASPGQSFDSFLADEIIKQSSTRPVIMITWLPVNGRKSTGCERDYGVGNFIGYSDILGGKCDTYIRNYAREVAARGERFLIRFAHEMNIRDSNYSPAASGLGADSYVRLYRYVYDVFMAEHRKAGGDNVEWVWSPNYFSHPAEPWNYLHNYYPGDSYVDWIGLSGYNFYPRRGEPNRSFKEIYGDVDGTDAYYTSFLPGVLYDLACRYAKPQILAEFAAGGTDSTAANKVNWINDAYGRIPNYPFVRAVIWFNDFGWEDNTDIDLRVTNINPPPNLHSSINPAYRQAISPGLYKSSLPSVETVTPPSTYCGNGTTTFQVTPLSMLAQRGGSTYHTLTAMLYSARPTITFPNTPSGFSVQVVNNQLDPPWGRAGIRITVGSGVANGTYPVTVNVNGTNFTIQVLVVDEVSRLYIPAAAR